MRITSSQAERELTSRLVWEIAIAAQVVYCRNIHFRNHKSSLAFSRAARGWNSSCKKKGKLCQRPVWSPNLVQNLCLSHMKRFGPRLNAEMLSVCSSMVEPEERPSGAGQRLGAPESLGISTLEPGQRPPTMPPGRQISIRVQMLDDTQEVFEVSVRHCLLSTLLHFCSVLLYCIVFCFMLLHCILLHLFILY